MSTAALGEALGLTAPVVLILFVATLVSQSSLGSSLVPMQGTYVGTRFGINCPCVVASVAPLVSQV